MSEPMVVQYTPQRRGVNFVLHPSSRAAVEELAEVSPAAENVFVGRDAREEPEAFAVESVEAHVIGLLTGWSLEAMLERFGAVEFEKMPSEEVTRRIEG